MKKVLLRIFSAILALVCLVGAWACGVSVKDELDCKEIWEEIREEALANFDLMDAGIAELAANSDVYADGVGTYRDGLGTYNAGRAELAAGKAKLEEGQAAYDANSAKLSEAHKAYDEGVAAIAAGKIELEQGKKELEEGKATLAANKQAYEEGKAQLAKVQPIYAIVKPLHNQYVNLQQQYDKAVAEGDNDRAAVLAIEVAAAKRIFEAELANTGYSMDSLVAEYEAGQAKIAEYEAGQKKVAEGEKKIAEAEATIAAGARDKDAYLIEEPMAASIGAGLPVAEPTGSMIVDIGGGTAEIAVISLGGIVASRSVRMAGDMFDQAIIAFIKRKYNLLIGERTAEQIKIEIGSAYALDPEMTMEIKGRNLVDGLPKNIVVHSEDVRGALLECLVKITTAIKETLERTPPELSADIIDRGITLTGGGALLRGLDQLIQSETGIDVHIAEDPLDCVAKGAGAVLDHVDVLHDVLDTDGGHM